MVSTLTRSQLLGAGARGGAALLLTGAPLAAFAATAGATAPASALGALPAGDLAYTRLLIGVELLAVDFYSQAIAARHLRGEALASARLALANEQAHYSYLAGVLSGAGQTPLSAQDVNFSYPARSFYTAASLTSLATTLEKLSLGAALGAGAALTTPALAGAVAQLAANEAQHLCALARRGRPPFQDAFPAPLTIEEASDALAAYTS